ncbi:Exonuclease RNase T and DNA polymerase III [Phocaeicola salanitronis DSM 18170]|uniref:Exonuclease RNase T and DNA polymerase III n=1 Tax=Phocaeicola salanitronis (strain DSM 18170 / JCM 13657 / CCUG 60908 / BL78) TaxID=667015 RepID=F0R7M4_PHOSB|nr:MULTISPECIES: 3'-5' exonuclease [Bacteroidaceae]ADY34931.1 Exonuclease RNase T and DNA polymerase III [Phocaeicola salanitronis DSM 18170]
MQGINFIAIDFETATGKRASICEAGICVVRNGEVTKTRSWLVRPQGNRYSYWNMQIHGIRPNDTVDSPEFPEVWAEISEYLKDIPILVAHNAAFDVGCIRHSLELYGMEKPDITYYCSLRAARKLYDFGCNSLDYLCDQFKIPYGRHHRAGDDAEMCARLFLREIKDFGLCGLEEMKYYSGKL